MRDAVCAGGSSAANARLRVLQKQYHLAVIKAALTKELIAKHRELIRIQEEACQDPAKDKRLLRLLHNLRMLFVGDVEAFGTEAQELERELAGIGGAPAAAAERHRS